MASEKSISVDKKFCLKIFPNEVWETILSKVNQVSDYFKISNASSHFRTLLLKFRASEILFTEAAKDLLCGEFGIIGKGFTTKEITPLRQVCKSWRSGVDSVLQDLDSFTNTPYIHEEDDNFMDNQVDRFEGTEEYFLFEQHFDDTHLEPGTNPFLGRRVIFTFGNDREDDLDEIYRTCSQLLTKYGRHIWYCGIHLNMFDPFERHAFYNKFHQFLSKMPNLQGLELYEFFADTFRIPDTFNVEGPFPELQQLHHLYLHGPPLKVIQGILARNPQILNLDISGPQSPESVRTYMQLPKLEELSVLPRERERTFETFRRTRLASRSVKRLRLNMVPMEGTVSWKTTFRVLHTHFSESLEQIVLTLLRPKPGDNFFHRGLVLENLKVLELEMVIPVPLSFIMPMVNNLETLRLLTAVGEESESFQIAKETEVLVKVYQFWRQLEKSNAWEIFPKLKLMMVGTDSGLTYSCTRDEWKIAIENKKRSREMVLVKPKLCNY